MFSKFWLFVFLLANNVSYSQIEIGLLGGVSNNLLNTNITNRASTKIDKMLGYNIEAPICYTFNNLFFVQISPNITQKNYSISRTDSLLGVYMQNNNTYFQIPISVGFLVGNRLKIFTNTGAYIGYWISGEEKGKIPNIFSVTNSGNRQQTEIFQLTTYSQSHVFNSQRDNRIELGWGAGGGLKYKLSKKYSLVAEVLFYKSLTDQQTKYMINQTPQYNQTFIFSVGFFYSFKNIKGVCK